MSVARSASHDQWRRYGLVADGRISTLHSGTARMFYRRPALNGVGRRLSNDHWLRLRNHARQCAESGDALSLRRRRVGILSRAYIAWSETRATKAPRCAATMDSAAGRMAALAVSLSGPGSDGPVGRTPRSGIFRSVHFDWRDARGGRLVRSREMVRGAK